MGRKAVGVTKGLGEEAGGLYDIRTPVVASSASLIPSGIGAFLGKRCNLGLTRLKPISRESFGLIGMLRDTLRRDCFLLAFRLGRTTVNLC